MPIWKMLGIFPGAKPLLLKKETDSHFVSIRRWRGAKNYTVGAVMLTWQNKTDCYWRTDGDP